MFETGDAVIPLATAVQWVLALGGLAIAAVGYVWRWTLQREREQQDRFDQLRQLQQEREQGYATDLREELAMRHQDAAATSRALERLSERLPGGVE